MTDDPTTSPTTSAAPAVAGTAAGAGAPAISEDMVKLALRRVKDPELNLNILDLGLVYDIVIEGSTVRVDMSLTSPACPSGTELVDDATNQVRAVPGVTDAQVFLVWSPPWTPDRIEPRVRTYLGF
jgi:metal-sulfur cluster biosynthetic enzyme